MACLVLMAWHDMFGTDGLTHYALIPSLVGLGYQMREYTQNGWMTANGDTARAAIEVPGPRDAAEP